MARRFTLRTKLEKLQKEVNMVCNVPCASEDNKKYMETLKNGESLPAGVYRYYDDDGEESDRFYEIYRAEDLSSEERLEYILLQGMSEFKEESLSSLSRNQRLQIDLLRSIAKMIKFFVVLSVIGIIASLISLITITASL